jgi:hypothetical protein
MPRPSGVAGTCRFSLRGCWAGAAAAAAAAAAVAGAPPGAVAAALAARPLLVAAATAAAARLLPAPPAGGGRLVAAACLSLLFCSRVGGILERTCSSNCLVLLYLQHGGYAGRQPDVSWKVLSD